MNPHFTRFVLLAAALLALPVVLSLGLVGATCLRSRLLADTAPQSDGGEEKQRRHQLEQLQVDVFHRIEAREAVTQEVMAGHLRLVEAAARYRALDAASPSFKWYVFRIQTPGRTDEEKHCREVINAVNTHLAKDPERSRAVTGRLEAELEDLLQSGSLRLAE